VFEVEPRLRAVGDRGQTRIARRRQGGLGVVDFDVGGNAVGEPVAREVELVGREPRRLLGKRDAVGGALVGEEAPADVLLDLIFGVAFRAPICPPVKIGTDTVAPTTRFQERSPM
jgi:hypothetical protein